jgi:hypothetical protein
MRWAGASSLVSQYPQYLRESNIRAITNGGENAIVGCDWPLPE